MNLFWVVEDEDEQQEVGQKVRVKMKWVKSSQLGEDEKANSTFGPLIITILEVFHGSAKSLSACW